MEKENNKAAVGKSESFLSLVMQAKNGDTASIIEIIKVFESDIIELARYIRLPREDAIQTLKTELITLILQSDYR